MKKATTKNKTMSTILKSFEQSRKAGINEVVGQSKQMGSYMFQDITGFWVASSTTDLKKSMYKAGIDQFNINTVKLETANTHKQLLQQANKVHGIAADCENFINCSHGHGGIKRPVKVVDTTTKKVSVVDSAYDAAEMIGTSRINVYNRLIGHTKNNTIGKYKVSYSYTI